MSYVSRSFITQDKGNHFEKQLYIVKYNYSVSDKDRWLVSYNR